MRTLKTVLVLLALASPAMAQNQEKSDCPKGQRLQSVGGEARCLPDTTGGKFATYAVDANGRAQATAPAPEPTGRQVAPGVRVTTAEEETGQKCADFQLDEKGDFFCADKVQSGGPVVPVATAPDTFTSDIHDPPCKTGETEIKEKNQKGVDVVVSCSKATLTATTGATGKRQKPETIHAPEPNLGYLDEAVEEAMKKFNQSKTPEAIRARAIVLRDNKINKVVLDRYVSEYCNAGILWMGKSKNYDPFMCQAAKELRTAVENTEKSVNAQQVYRRRVQLENCGDETVLHNIPREQEFVPGNLSTMVNNYDTRFKIAIVMGKSPLVTNLCKGGRLVLPMYMDYVSGDLAKSFHYTFFARLPDGRTVWADSPTYSVSEWQRLYNRVNQAPTLEIKIPELDRLIAQYQDQNGQNNGTSGRGRSGGRSSSGGCSSNPFDENFCGPRR